MLPKSTDTERLSIPEFCVFCGANFPPREGEGICKDYSECLKKTKAYRQLQKESGFVR